MKNSKHFGKALNQIGQEFQRLGEVATRVSFSLLDYRLSETPLEDRPVRSWEVEREEFLRKLDSGA